MMEKDIDLACEALEEDEDCISRQAVIDKAVYMETEEGWSGRTVDVKVIEALPPVTPQSKTGHWIANKAKNYPGWVHCSECGEDWTHDGRPPYCPNCGAKMIESEEEDAKSDP